MYLNIALPKGRLGNQSYQILKQLGYDCPEFEEESRKLIFENKEKGIRFFLVKASDVAIYVERGVADVGIVGKDILLEEPAQVLEMLDLQYGACHFAVAAPTSYEEDHERTLVVATKYVRIANDFYKKQNREIELVKLNGSVELAPLVHLADVIVDIVETGSTLRENNLKIVEKFLYISARLIVNEANLRFKTKRIETLVQKMRKVVGQ